MATKRYITHVRKSSEAKHESEITQYKYFIIEGVSKKFYSATKHDFCDKYFTKGYVFSYISEENKVECELKISKDGEKYLQTTSDGTKSNNLINLPSF